MSKEHLDLELLQEAVSQVLSEGERARIANHLNECPQCLSLTRSISPEDLPKLQMIFEIGREPLPDAYSGVFDRVFDSITAESAQLDQQRASATELSKELERFGPLQRRLLIRNSRRFQNWSLAEALLESSQETWTEDPHKCELLATIGFEVADSLEVEGFRRKILSDLKAEAWTYIANARRIRSDLRGAEAAFGAAKMFLDSGTGDPMEAARFLDLRSSLARASRDFTLAGRWLKTAIRLYRQAEDHHLEGRALIKQARLLLEMGSVDESIDSLRQAGELIDPARDPWLHFVQRKNLVAHLNEAGRADEARALLPEVRALAREHGNRFDRLRLLWIEGLVCRSLGQVEMAEEALKQVREGFIDAGIGYDVALVSLDLAALYLEQGRTAEVKALGAETIPQFLARNIAREALTAIALFQEAARREGATLELVRETAERIKSARPESA